MKRRPPPAPSPYAAWHRAVYRAWKRIDDAEQALASPWCADFMRHNWQAALARAQAQRTAAIGVHLTIVEEAPITEQPDGPVALLEAVILMAHYDAQGDTAAQDWLHDLKQIREGASDATT